MIIMTKTAIAMAVMFAAGMVCGIIFAGQVAKKKRAREKKQLVAEARYAHAALSQEQYRRAHSMPTIG